MKPATATKVDSTPHLLVEKQGFSQRPDKLGTGSTVSYGLLLKNTSGTQDATETYLLINFATAGGELIGTVTKKVDLVAANGSFAFGPGQAVIVEGKEEQGFLEPLPLSLLPLGVGTRTLKSAKGSGCAGSASWRRFRGGAVEERLGPEGKRAWSLAGGERGTRLDPACVGDRPRPELAEALAGQTN